MDVTYEDLFAFIAKTSELPLPPKISIMRDIPSIAELERKLFLFSNMPDQLDVELDSIAERTSMEVFGVTRHQTEFVYPSDYESLSQNSELSGQILDDFNQHEEDYLLSDYGDVDAVKILLHCFGIDFRDENGNPMLCVRYLKRQAEIAAKGLKGKLPDMDSINNANEEGKMLAKAQREADDWKKKQNS
jgi:hypothetical protein